MSFTVAEIESALERDPEFSWYVLEYRRPEAIFIHGERYDFEVIASKHGEEGDWHTGVYVVFRIGDQTFRKIGYYASHDGEYWDGPLTEVTPEENVVIVWKDK